MLALLFVPLLGSLVAVGCPSVALLIFWFSFQDRDVSSEYGAIAHLVVLRWYSERIGNS